MKSFVLVALLCVVLNAQNNKTPDLLPTLREVFADIATVLAQADQGRIEVLSARLKETGDEIRLLETLAAALSRGILVDLPQALREKGLPNVRPETMAQEQQKLEELRAELKLVEGRKRATGVPDGLLRARKGSFFAEAALERPLDIPVPALSSAGTPSAVAQSAQPEALGRALYQSKDWKGALTAFEALAPQARTTEVNCLMARCLERLDRWDEARQLYEATAKAEQKGPWGDLARWMLRFGGQKNTVRAALEAGAIKGGK
jgi:hypothetical protein